MKAIIRIKSIGQAVARTFETTVKGMVSISQLDPGGKFIVVDGDTRKFVFPADSIDYIELVKDEKE
jgi:hypothetical protein